VSKTSKQIILPFASEAANINNLDDSLQARFFETRKLTETLVNRLSPEDQMLQSMPDASPAKWHLAHTTWFFDTFILKPRGIKVSTDPSFEFLFNSYYEQVGPQFLRAQRGLLSRPSVEQILKYRRVLDLRMFELWDTFDEHEKCLVMLGIAHEQQHQELILTDIKHAFSYNPAYPALTKIALSKNDAIKVKWHDYPGGNYSIGASHGFYFDNESPQHDVFVQGFRLANRPSTNAEYLAFMEDDGYTNSLHWLSEGWAWVQQSQRKAPLYWMNIDGEWFNYTLGGLLPVDLALPICHINYFEASAFASWMGKRLPTEMEWEIAASKVEPAGKFLNRQLLHPKAATGNDGRHPVQLFGDVWEWTQSAYLPYPGFKPGAGAVGEYNGKFMVNQWVLRGGSCVTPPGHIRATYRNFFPVNASWQFSGVRLADDVF
jgi:ergothioneine biosynthesis protein EgtB